MHARTRSTAVTELRAVLKNSALPLDNTRSERALRKIVTGRKSWMFYGSDAHAESAAAIFSLIATCRLHGVEPRQYLDELMRVLPYWPSDRYLELAPFDATQLHAGRNDTNPIRRPTHAGLSCARTTARGNARVQRPARRHRGTRELNRRDRASSYRKCARRAQQRAAERGSQQQSGQSRTVRNRNVQCTRIERSSHNLDGSCRERNRYRAGCWRWRSKREHRHGKRFTHSKHG